MSRVFVDFNGTLTKWEWVGPDVYAKAGYNRNLEPIPNMVQAVKSLIEKGADVYVLGAVLNDDHSIEDRDYWFDNNLPELDKAHRIYVPYGANKDDYAKPSEKDILVDDYNPNLEDWTGIPVKIMNGENGKSGEWQGRTIDHRSNPDIIALTIEAWQHN